MSTLRQIEANRRNAQKSTGPTSVTGKAISSMNALKTGLHAESIVLPSENPADFEQLIEDYYHYHQPSTPDARAFVDDLIFCEWTLRRLRATAQQMVQHQNADKFRDPHQYPLGRSATSFAASYSKLQYRLDATRRARLNILHELKQLKEETAPPPALEPLEPPSLSLTPQTTSSGIGFVPATPSAAPLQPPPEPPGTDPQHPAPVASRYARIR